jgi:hypothetical protein
MVANYEIKQNRMTNRKALVFQFACRNGIDCTMYMYLNYGPEANTAL